jgi:Peptidase A4 family
MFVKQILAAAGTVALAGGLAGGIATQAQAKVHVPVPVRVSDVAGSRPFMALGPGSTVNTLHSLNWAGYVTTGGGSFASANWVVPFVHGSSGDYSSSWVGVDGAGSPTVEQTGTASATLYGQSLSYAWVELYPAGTEILRYKSGAEAPVHSSDHMSGSVSARGDRYTIKLTDHTQNWQYAQTITDPAGMNASAEVITEAPSSARTGNILPLANFGSEHFTAAHISGHASRTNMVSRSGRAKATVTGPQRNFTVHFKYRGQFSS